MKPLLHFIREIPRVLSRLDVNRSEIGNSEKRPALHCSLTNCSNKDF